MYMYRLYRPMNLFTGSYRGRCKCYVQTTRTGQVCFHTSLIALAGGFTRFPSTEIDHAAELPEGKMPCFGSCGRIHCGLDIGMLDVLKNKGTKMNLVFAESFAGKVHPCPFPQDLSLFIHRFAHIHTHHDLIIHVIQSLWIASPSSKLHLDHLESGHRQVVPWMFS